MTVNGHVAAALLVSAAAQQPPFKRSVVKTESFNNIECPYGSRMVCERHRTADSFPTTRTTASPFVCSKKMRHCKQSHVEAPTTWQCCVASGTSTTHPKKTHTLKYVPHTRHAGSMVGACLFPTRFSVMTMRSFKRAEFHCKGASCSLHAGSLCDCNIL